MSEKPASLFATVPEDVLHLYSGGTPDGQRVVKLLGFMKRDVSHAADLPENSIRYDEKAPLDLQQRLKEWANLLNLVAVYFEGDADKAGLWFTMPNPQLGGMTPRDMIRVGRYNKLLRFVMNALNENER